MGHSNTSTGETTGDITDDRALSHETEEVDDFALRPIVMPSREVLAAAAGRAATFASVTRLARLLDPHGTRGSDVLRLQQAKALATMLPTGDLDRARAAGVTVRSTKQLPEVRRLHRLAVAGGLLGDAGSRQPAPEGEDVLDGWWRFFSTLLDSGILDATTQGRDVLAEIVDDLLVHVLLNLYANDVITTDLVAAVLRGAVADFAGPLVRDFDEDEEAVFADPLHGLAHRVARELAGLGVVEPTRLDDEEAHAITPLGLWAVNRLLRQLEVDAPVFGELADADAQTLYETCTTWELDDGQREIANWIAGRGAHDAAGELAELARRTDDPAARQFAIATLFALDAAAEPVMRSLRDDPLLGPHAAVWLVDAELEDASTLDDVDTDGAIRAITDDLVELLGPDALGDLPADLDPEVAELLTSTAKRRC